jgi:hypothetical protein
LDKNVNICLVRQYFTHDAWIIVEKVVQRKRELDVWLCVSCQDTLEGKQAIICELCLQWYHFSCVGVATEPKKKNWFCRHCYAGMHVVCVYMCASLLWILCYVAEKKAPCSVSKECWPGRGVYTSMHACIRGSYFHSS